MVRGIGGRLKDLPLIAVDGSNGMTYLGRRVTDIDTKLRIGNYVVVPTKRITHETEKDGRRTYTEAAKILYDSQRSFVSGPGAIEKHNIVIVHEL